AVGDQMRLVIAAGDPTARREREDAVGCSRHLKAVARLDGEPAGQEKIARSEHRRRLGALQLREWLAADALVDHRVGDRGLGPEDEPRLSGGLAGKRRELPRRLLVEAGLPFVFLADVGLNNADV